MEEQSWQPFLTEAAMKRNAKWLRSFTDGRPTMTEHCTWVEDEDGVWHTECGDMFVIIDGIPKENNMRYCCYCGKSLHAISYSEENND